MKRILLILFFLVPVFASAQDEGRYPWILTIFGGGASLCDDAGCFGPSGLAFGGSFGRHMTERWSFELEGSFTSTNETLAPRIDLGSGLIFTPTLDRTRVWGGGHFLGKLAGFGSSSDFFISIGVVGGYEQQVVNAPEGIFVEPTRDIGIKGGLAGGAGMNLWFSDSWGARPEVRYYLVVGSLSGVRYTVGLMHKF